MTSPVPSPETLKTLIVEVCRHHDGRTTFRQPRDWYRDDYRVYDHQHQEPRIVIYPHVCPVHLQFNANVPLTAIGFAEVGGGPVSKHTAPGPCGGCFSLVYGFNLGEPNTPLILNKGDRDKPQGGRYHCTLWTSGDDGSDVVLTAGIDPQIYNQGDGPGDEL